MNLRAGGVAREVYAGRDGIGPRDDAPGQDAEYREPMSLRARVERWVDPALAVGFTAAIEYEVLVTPPAGLSVTGGRGVLAVVAALVTVPLAWRRRAPLAALSATSGAILLGASLTSGGNGMPLAAFIALIVSFYSVGAHCDDRRGIVGGGAVLVVVLTYDLVRGGLGQSHGSRPGAALIFGFAWLVGRELRRRRRELALLRERTSRLEHEREEQARTAVIDERARIARELHDVVAHSVSVMVVQAQAGPRMLADPDQAAAAFRSIETVGRQALVELRRLLGILRTGDEELVIGPQPGLGSLDSLVDQVREAGLPVELRVEGEQVQLPPGVDLSAYRIVQEALTNALKHAGAARAEIVVRFGDAALELEILDDGPGAGPAANGGGHGLIGMRERAGLYGGVLEAGTRVGGGYAVRARLPLAGEPQR
jgi:signal transduction histidine kinase